MAERMSPEQLKELYGYDSESKSFNKKSKGLNLSQSKKPSQIQFESDIKHLIDFSEEIKEKRNKCGNPMKLCKGYEKLVTNMQKTYGLTHEELAVEMQRYKPKQS